ncbi:MAG: OmpA family protein [Aurantibacter sp.]
MNTMKLTRHLPIFCLLFVFLGIQNVEGQRLKDRIKKTLEDKVVDEVDKGLNGNNKEVVGNKEDQRTVKLPSEERAIDKNFINGNIVFSDNFNNEKHGEFPSKWTQMTGTMQNSQVVALEKEEGVVQFITSSRMKPTFKNDDYLGNSFKIEGQFLFHGKGNEAYTLHLMNNNDPYKAYQVTIRGDGIVPAGSSSEYARMPHKLPYPGWRTVQLSFNNGILKIKYEGYQLINNHKLNKGDDNLINEFTHLELSALSRSGNYGAMINHITIAHGGLPLYKKLMAEGRLVVHDIHFEVDKYNIKEESYPALDKILVMLQEHEDMEVNIEGHTDANGTNEDNQTLSEKRAEAVKNYFVSKGVKRYRLSSKGYGEEKPISMGDTEEAWAQNRRVEFVLNH